MLKQRMTTDKVECGCDEAGRGCLSGPVYAAAVILPPNYTNKILNDSKQLTARQRQQLRQEIEHDALAWAVASISPQEIDKINILKASIHAMNEAVKKLKINPQLLLIDGNRFVPEVDIDYRCVVKGDATYMSIAAASVLAKTYRDEYMQRLHVEYPQYGWNKNKGYPTKQHYDAIDRWGVTQYHRKSFKLHRDPTLFDSIE